ncbi:MAG: hypothetical protein RR657_04110 [Peptostreptococcaceae bacterium]
MNQNNGCCTPPYPKKDDCCCKDGIICALDLFYQDFLSTTQCFKEIKYYPSLPTFDVGGTIKIIPNTITDILYITPDIVPIYTDDTKEDLTYLNICKINGFEFTIDTTNTSCNFKDTDITNRFNKVRYVSPKSCCCKNGILEYLLKTREFLQTPPKVNAAIISTSTNSFKITDILAINPDTLWAKNVITDPTASTTYYVLSLCEITGITLDKFPLI